MRHPLASTVRRLFSRISSAGGVLTLGAVAVHAILVAFIRSYSPTSGELYDGLGRLLTPAPPLYRLFNPDEPRWPGLGWVMIDLVGGLVALGLAACLFRLARALDDRPEALLGCLDERNPDPGA